VVGRKHCTLEQLLEHRLLPVRERDELLVVATVRNPFDRLVTYYQKLAGSRELNYAKASEKYLNRQRFEATLEESVAREAFVKRTEQRMKRGAVLRRLGYRNWLMLNLVRWRFRRHNRRPGLESPVHYEEAFPMLGGVDVAMRFERLEDALNQVLRSRGHTSRVSIPHRNATRGKAAYSAYYGTLSRRLAERVLAHDLRLLGYTFDGPTSEDSVIHLRSSVEGIRGLSAAA